MRKKIEKDNFIIELETSKKPNGVSCVSSVRCFIRPKTLSKTNSTVVDEVEKSIGETARRFVLNSDLLSDNHIADFDCTRENLNIEKWSRVKADLYIFTPFIECEDELVTESVSLCDCVGETMGRIFRSDNQFETSRVGT